MCNFKHIQFNASLEKVVFCYLSLDGNRLISNREPSWLKNWHPQSTTDSCWEDQMGKRMTMCSPSVSHIAWEKIQIIWVFRAASLHISCQKEKCFLPLLNWPHYHKYTSRSVVRISIACCDLNNTMPKNLENYDPSRLYTFGYKCFRCDTWLLWGLSLWIYTQACLPAKQCGFQ